MQAGLEWQRIHSVSYIFEVRMGKASVYYHGLTIAHKQTNTRVIHLKATQATLIHIYFSQRNTHQLWKDSKVVPSSNEHSIT